MDRVSRAVLTMMALAVFGMSLLIAYGVSDMAPKTDTAPEKPAELAPPPAPARDVAEDEVDELDEFEEEDEDLSDFGEPVIDLDDTDDEAADEVLAEDGADTQTASGENLAEPEVESASAPSGSAELASEALQDAASSEETTLQ